MIDCRGKVVGSRLETRGIDWGRRGGKPLWPTIMHRVGDIIVLKVHGYTGWVSQGESGHHPANYSLARLSEPGEDGMMLVTAIPGTDCEPGARWRSAVRELSAKAEELAKR